LLGLDMLTEEFVGKFWCYGQLLQLVDELITFYTLDYTTKR